MIELLKKGIFRLYSLKNTVFGSSSFKGVKILLYHNVDEKYFETHLKYLKSKYEVISLKDMLSKFLSGDELSNTFVITFDDGVKENYSLLSIIKKYNIEPTIFITNHVTTNQRYWFNGLQQEELIKLLEVPNHERLEIIGNYIEKKNITSREALSLHELNEMKDFVDFQPHTVTHPSLVQCSEREIEDEIKSSYEFVKNITGEKPVTFAPPFGIYDERVIEVLKKLSFKASLTVTPGINSNHENLFALKRIGVPKTCDLNEFITRIDGVWDMIRGLPIFKDYSSFYNQYYE